MYLAVSVSIPVTRLNFLSYVFNSTQTLSIGMWGSCTAPISASGVVGSHTCTKAKLGFLVGKTFLSHEGQGGGALGEVDRGPPLINFLLVLLSLKRSNNDTGKNKRGKSLRRRKSSLRIGPLRNRYHHGFRGSILATSIVSFCFLGLSGISCNGDGWNDYHVYFVSLSRS